MIAQDRVVGPATLGGWSEALGEPQERVATASPTLPDVVSLSRLPLADFAINPRLFRCYDARRSWVGTRRSSTTLANISPASQNTRVAYARNRAQ